MKNTPLMAEQWVKVSDQIPTTGRKVLAFYRNELGKGRTVMAHFTAARTETADSFEFSDENEDWYDMDETGTSWVPEGWYEDSETQEVCPMIYDEITHWMPLPEAPNV